MNRMTARRFAAVLALAGFLCTVALAAADVVRISPPWKASVEDSTFVQAEEPAEQPPPPPLEEDYHVPAAPPADEPKPQKSSKRRDRDAKRDERDAEDRRDQTADDEESDDRGSDRRVALPRERTAGALEDVSDLGEDLGDVGEDVGDLGDDVVPDPLCDEPEACLTLLSEALGCDSFAGCEELYLGDPEGGEEEPGDDQEPLVLDRESEDPVLVDAEAEEPVLVDGETEEEPFLSCDSEESCAELLVALFGCDSFEACERLYLGAIVPDEAPTVLEQTADR